MSLSLGLFHGQWTEPSRYLCYLALALLASGMKVNLPGVHGTMSVIFLFILIGVRELTLAQTLLMGVLGTKSVEAPKLHVQPTATSVEHDPAANFRRVEASRPGFHFRATHDVDVLVHGRRESHKQNKR